MTTLLQYLVQKTLSFTTFCSHYSRLKAFSSSSSFTIIIWPSLTRNLPLSPLHQRKKQKRERKKAWWRERRKEAERIYTFWEWSSFHRRIQGTFKVWFERWFLPRWVKFYKMCLRFSFLGKRGLFFFLSSLKTWFLHTRISLDPEGEGGKKRWKEEEERGRGECQSGMSLISPWKGKERKERA